MNSTHFTGRKLRSREGEPLLHGHLAEEWRSWDWNPEARLETVRGLCGQFNGLSLALLSSSDRLEKTLPCLEEVYVLFFHLGECRCVLVVM